MDAAREQASAPVVTVAMPIYNAGRYLRMAVSSIVFQTFDDWELLIIDDGSTDNALASITDILDPRIKIFCDGHNRGLAARLNQAIDHARGEFLARMDQDDVSYPDRLARQVTLLRQDGTLDIVASRALLIDENNHAIGQFPFAEGHEAITARPWQGFPFPHPSWMGRRSWFRKHRYARPGPFFCEDQELLLRSYPVSRFGVVDEVLFAYRVRSRFNPTKQFKTRKAFWQVQCAQFQQRRQWRNVLLSTAMFAGRVLLDGLRQLAWRLGKDIAAPKLSPEPLARWYQVCDKALTLSRANIP